jgi:hypothetical protein
MPGPRIPRDVLRYNVRLQEKLKGGEVIDAIYIVFAWSHTDKKYSRRCRLRVSESIAIGRAQRKQRPIRTRFVNGACK